jgi:transketolase
VRNAFIDTLCALAEQHEDIVLLCGDLGYSVLERFADRFPRRFYNVGVAEQNMTGLAAGLAMSGKLVVTYSIANFAVVRCLEQLRNDVCYHNAPVIAVSVGSGMAYGGQGYTHHGIEDMAFTRILPNMAVVSPGDPAETRWALRRLVERRGPASMRLGRGGEPALHGAEIEAQLGDLLPILPGGADVTLLSTGAILPESLAAANALRERGVDAGLVSVPAVIPLDEDAIRQLAGRSRLLVSVEEHVTEGGFGGAIAEIVAGIAGPRASLLRAGIRRNGPKTAADQREARRLHGIDAVSLVDAILAHPAWK